MSELSNWSDVSSPVFPGRFPVTQHGRGPALVQVFAMYLSGELAFPAMRAEVVSAHRALCGEGEGADSICRFLRRALDRGASRATPSDNVHRFNAIHDELTFWVTGLCRDGVAEDSLIASPLADI